jgi:hypothetical protein
MVTDNAREFEEIGIQFPRVPWRWWRRVCGSMATDGLSKFANRQLEWAGFNCVPKFGALAVTVSYPEGSQRKPPSVHGTYCTGVVSERRVRVSQPYVSF